MYKLKEENTNNVNANKVSRILDKSQRLSDIWISKNIPNDRYAKNCEDKNSDK